MSKREHGRNTSKLPLNGTKIDSTIFLPPAQFGAGQGVPPGEFRLTARCTLPVHDGIYFLCTFDDIVKTPFYRSIFELQGRQQPTSHVVYLYGQCDGGDELRSGDLAPAACVMPGCRDQMP